MSKIRSARSHTLLRYLFRGSCLLFITHMLLGLYSPYFRAYQNLVPTNFFWDWEVMSLSTIAFPVIILLEICYCRFSRKAAIFPIALDAVLVSVWVIIFWLMAAVGLFLHAGWSI